jgi:hypothetical protein
MKLALVITYYAVQSEIVCDMMQAFAYKSFLVFCTMVVVLGVLTMLVDWELPDSELIDPSDLAKVQIGNVVHLSGLLKEPAEKVCLLTPYRDRLEETEPLSQQVNAHLKAVDLYLDDNGFALVFVNGDGVRVQRVRKVSTWHPWDQQVSRIFKPLGCSSVDRALVARSSTGYLIFGEQR